VGLAFGKGIVFVPPTAFARILSVRNTTERERTTNGRKSLQGLFFKQDAANAGLPMIGFVSIRTMLHFCVSNFNNREQV
jgi:hypothetical protein